jgi:alanine or glycine:cation symporter, AGCS family
MIETLTSIVGAISNFFWGPPLFIAVLGTGLYYTIAFKGNYQLKVGFHMKNTFGTMFAPAGEGEGTVRGFAAAATAIASTIGVGNVAGAATAFVSGGPGAIFWMWMTAFVGMSTKAAEIILGQRYRVKFESMDEYLCGRNYVMKNGLGWTRLAQVLAWTLVTSPWSLLVQTNAVATSLQQAFGFPLMVGIVVVFATLAVTIIGGVRRIAAVADKVVPFMAVFYITIGGILIIMNITEFIPALATIVRHAFTPYAGAGGVAGATVAQAMRFGVARGVYSNESGMGSGMGVHAAAIVDHPVRQASWGFGENFIDTIIVCTITAMSIMLTGANFANPTVTGAALTTIAWQTQFGAFGGYMLSISVALFAWTTLLSAYYGGEKSVNFLAGDTKLNRTATWVFIVYFLGPIFLAGADTGLLWLVTDTMTIIGVCAAIACLVALRKVVVELHNDFWYRYLPALEKGENPARVSFVSKP